MKLTRRNFIKNTVILSGAAGLAPVLAGLNESRQKQNILFIAMDDQNDWIRSFGGHPQARTPNIDKLAVRGIRFSNAHCVVPICGPSRAALFTGRQPWYTGIYTNDKDSLSVVGRQFRTLPQHLRAEGYNTYGAGKVFHGNIKTYPEDLFTEYGPGYNQFQPLTSKESSYSDEEFNSEIDKAYLTHVVDRGPGKLKATFPLNKMPRERRLGSRKIESFDWGPLPVADEEMDDYKTADWAINKLNQQHDKPFFLAAGFYRPHMPFFIPQKYYDMYPPDEIILPDVLGNDLDDIPPVGRDFAIKPYSAGSHKIVIEHNQWREAVACYLACISFVDDQVGRIVKALDKSPYRDNTTIVLWGDNGWHLGEKEHWGKFTGWEESTHVPLIIVPPVSRSGEFVVETECKQPVSLIDLYPTMLALNKIPISGELNGKNLLPFLSDPGRQVNDHVISTFGRGNHSIRTKKWRYTRYYDGSEELYDLGQDPNEYRNLAGVKELDQLKQELKSKLPAYDNIDYFVSMGFWKAVIYKNRKDTELYHFEDNRAVPEEANVYAEYPEVVDKMLDYIGKYNISEKYISLPD